MKLPDWVGISFGDLIAILLGGLLGKEFAEWGKDKKLDPTSKEALRSALAEALRFDRDAFLHGLRMMNVDTHGQLQPIVDLFYELNREKGILWVDGAPYPEVWIGKKLLSIEQKYRIGLYLDFANDLRIGGEEGRRRFIAKLQVLNDNGWWQYLRLAGIMVSGAWKAIVEVAKPFLEKRISALLGVQNIAEAMAYSRQREQALRAELAAQKQKGWLRRWLS